MALHLGQQFDMFLQSVCPGMSMKSGGASAPSMIAACGLLCTVRNADGEAVRWRDNRKVLSEADWTDTIRAYSVRLSTGEYDSPQENHQRRATMPSARLWTI